MILSSHDIIDQRVLIRHNMRRIREGIQRAMEIQYTGRPWPPLNLAWRVSKLAISTTPFIPYSANNLARFNTH